MTTGFQPSLGKGGVPKTNIYVGGLAEEVDEAVVKAAFLPFGPIKDINIPQDMETRMLAILSLPVAVALLPSVLSPPPVSRPTWHGLSNGSDGLNAESHRGFAFVDYVSAEDAAAAIDNMDQSELFGRTLKVNPSRELKTKEGSHRAGAEPSLRAL